ncbi:MAG: LysR family transcriptional regulator [Rhodobacteraceae bacterium]|nr:LysR family transcriptional regulator [Paracoccaceae bacterium]
MLRLGWLRTFQTVATKGTLEAAAAALGRTPSAVSMTLRQMEDALGAALFETDRKNRLTPFGQNVLEEATRAIEAFDRAERAIQRNAVSTAGSIRIASVPSAASWLLPAAVAAFRENHSGVHLDISDADSAEVGRRLRRDEADLGIATVQSGTELDGELLIRDRLGIVCRAGGPIAQSGIAPMWELLEKESMIGNPLCRLVDHAGVRRRAEQSPISARNTTTLLSFVRQGIGATILPETAIAGIASGLIFLAPDRPAAYRDLYIVTNRQRRMTPAALAFRDCLHNVGGVLKKHVSAGQPLSDPHLSLG